MALVIASAIPAYTQASPADGPWSGTIQCDVNVQEPNYIRQETQTWTLAGKNLGLNGAMRIFEATWTVTGQGRSLAGGQPSQILTSWTVSVPGTPRQFSFWVPPNQVIIDAKQWSSLMRSDNTVSITKQVTSNGMQQQPQTQLGATFEWNFGLIHDGLLNPGISGSTTIQVESLNATYQPGGVRRQDTAVCRYNLNRSASPANSYPTGNQCAQEDARITQAFDAMEADTRKQFEALIQQTQDPSIIASLRAQEQESIAQLESQKKNDIQANDASCQGGGMPANNPNGGSRNAVPQLLSVTPSSIEQGATNVQLTLTGQATNWQQNVTQLDLGLGITVSAGPMFPQATAAVVIVNVSDTAPIGPHAVTVITNSERVGLPAGLTITAKQPAAGVQIPGALAGATKNPGGQALSDPMIPTPPASGIIKDPGLHTFVATNPTTNPSTSNVTVPPGGIAGSLKQPNKGTSSAPGSGTYLVTVTGLRCGRSVRDDPFDRDGKGDEIYAAAYVRRYDRRTGQFLEQSARQTVEYGDTRNFPNRDQAGSLSPTGGIGDLDSIPPNASADRCCAPQDDRFPWNLWQGPLTDGADVLIISPSVWESDGNQSWLSIWGQAQNQLGQSLLTRQEVQDQINHKLFGPIIVGATPANSGNLTQAGAGVIIGALGVPFVGLPVQALTGGFKDRPIGLVPSGVDATVLPNTTIVLTREIIEAALSSGHPAVVSAAQGVNIVTPKPGIMVSTSWIPSRRMTGRV